MSYPPSARRSPRLRQIMIALVALGIAGFWVAQAMRSGRFTVDPSGVTMIVSTRPAAGERDVLANAFISADLNPGHAVDPHTLDIHTVRLYREKDKQPVPAHVNTSAAGDAIVLQPLEMLEPSTRYVFEVRGVRDTTGVELLPYSMTFTTAGGSQTTTYPAAFEKVNLSGEQAYYTGLAIGPDRKLYAGSVDGRIIRRDILDDGTLGPEQTIPTVQQANGAPRLITGIAFDPKSTKDAPTLWVSHGEFIMNQHGEPSLVGATDWTGKISTVSGPELSVYRDVVINLPRSFRDHLNNQISFGPDGALYWSQGSHTAMGAPDRKWGNRVERLLSAAVLRLDPGKVQGALDVKTADGGGSYDPFAPDAPLTIYASGVRVGYDMLWHSNGHLYTSVNGSAAGGRTPGSPSDRRYPRRIDGTYTGPEVTGATVEETQPDVLLKLEAGGYYGHPNPVRGEYVLNGGNPTRRTDLLEVVAYRVGTQPDRNWRKPAYSFGTSVSPNGMIEFQSHGRLFGGSLDGKLLITRFSGGKDVIVLALNERGDVVESITGIAGLTHFTEPLDLTQDPLTGCIYVAEYGGKELALIRPITDPSRLADIDQNVFRQQVRASVTD